MVDSMLLIVHMGLFILFILICSGLVINKGLRSDITVYYDEIVQMHSETVY